MNEWAKHKTLISRFSQAADHFPFSYCFVGFCIYDYIDYKYCTFIIVVVSERNWERDPVSQHIYLHKLRLNKTKCPFSDILTLVCTLKLLLQMQFFLFNIVFFFPVGQLHDPSLLPLFNSAGNELLLSLFMHNRN